MNIFRIKYQWQPGMYGGWISIFIGIILFLMPPAVSAYPAVHPAAGDRISDPYLVREFTIRNAAMLRVFTVSGDIEVVRRKGDRVRIELYIDRGYAFWSTSKNLDNYRIVTMQRGNEVVASVEKKGRETSFFGDQLTFSYKIYVPETVSAELKTLRGNIQLHGVRGSQSLKTSGGNIEVSGITGHLQAFTAGGNVVIRNSRGTIFGQTEGGNINVIGGEGELRLRTSGGRMNLERISGAMLAQAGGGDIKAHFLHIAEGVSLSTSAGNIVMNAPRSEGYDLVIRGSDIRFNRDADFRGKSERRTVEGRYKKGGVPINLTTNSGTISLKIAGN